MVQMMMPAKGGTLTIRSDTVRYDMGELVPGEWESMTGTCFSGGCNPAGGKTRATGSLIAAAWDNGVWAFDIGTTPIGFHYTDITGALSYSFNWGDTSLTAEAYRRAKDASLLAYGGQRDPATGNGGAAYAVRACRFRLRAMTVPESASGARFPPKPSADETSPTTPAGRQWARPTRALSVNPTMSSHRPFL